MKNVERHDSLPSLALLDIRDAPLLSMRNMTVLYNSGIDQHESATDWQDVRLSAQVMVGDEVLNKTVGHVPVFNIGAKTVLRWDLGDLEVSANCSSFTLTFSTQSRFPILSLVFYSTSNDGQIDWKVDLKQNHLNFDAFMDLFHQDTSRYRRVLWRSRTAVILELSQFQHPSAIEAVFDQMTSAETLSYAGAEFYGWYQRGNQKYLKLALTAFERALEDPEIDPDHSLVLETITPFLYCLEQGSGSCLDVAFEVLQVFHGLPNAQIPLQTFLQFLVLSVVHTADWYNYLALAAKSVYKSLEVLSRMSSSGMIWYIHALWVSMANSSPPTRELFPILNLVSLIPVTNTPSPAFRAQVSRACLYLKWFGSPVGPSLDNTITAAEAVMHTWSCMEPALHSDPSKEQLITFTKQFHSFIINQLGKGFAFEHHRDRVLGLITWQLSNLPSTTGQEGLKLAQVSLSLDPSPINMGAVLNAFLPQAVALKDNDHWFIQRVVSPSFNPEKDQPAEYPKGAAELARRLLASCAYDALACLHTVSIAHALGLPEALQAYRIFITSLESVINLPVLLSGLPDVCNVFLAIREGASCAVDAKDPSLALQWIDQGCSRVWDSLFHSRATSDRIGDMEPPLANRLLMGPRWMNEKPNSQLEVDIDWYRIAQPVQLLPGFGGFLRPKPPSEIMALAEALGGPIIYLNINRYSSHALAVVAGSDNPIHIPLPVDDYSMFYHLSLNFMKCPQDWLYEDALTRGNRESNRKGLMVKPGKATQPACPRPAAKELLKLLWLLIVKPVLDGLGIQRSRKVAAEMPRVWWCPSGPLSAFPLHAAGIYEDDRPVISDYVVSSYFPSASALSYATRPDMASQTFSLLTIANPTGARLPGTMLELQKIKKHAAPKALTGEEATVDAVKQGMKDASWVHFACHGVAKPGDFRESALILANHARLTLGELSKISLPHAQFAFLSACQTAKGMDKVPEHSAHLTTGMLACGYRSVIGTMWKIKDEYAPFVADRVYEKMLDGGQPDYKRAAFALHDAVQALRKEHNVDFETWLPFIHVGV